MSRPSLIVHGHFYQPPRLDPFSGTMPRDPTAAPAHDWNERIAADCYRPNAEVGNLGAMSWDLGPTLAGWLQEGDPVAYRGFVAGDAGVNGMAQPFHHAIMPLASAADRRTEIRWGLRDFAYRFGRPATGVWLPETAVDRDTLRLLVDAGVTYTILAPWQVAGRPSIDSRRPVRVDLGAGTSIVAVLYDAGLSTAISFDPASTVDADAFVRERLMPHFAAGVEDEGDLVVIAADGELYGHHQPFRELFLARLVGATAPTERPYDTPRLADAIAAEAARGLPLVELRERTSWSCHHGVARWMADCPCVADGSWKTPLRAAFDRLAGGIDAATDHLASALPGAPDPWLARDAYVDVVIGATSREAFVVDQLGASADADHARVLLDLMEAQRWRLAMFASCAWFWDVPDRVETASALRAAVRAARLADGLADTDLERRLMDDLALVEGKPGDGRDLVHAALAAVGAAPERSPENPSARGLRATG
ncbi:MAG TPA: DUF3536 domain-containing protein [Candidatus Limnocylindrales bacterium]|nr:DUF3536 domain-containing protein [Candidatus Limnocylindrales bacterium]